MASYYDPVPDWDDSIDDRDFDDWLEGMFDVGRRVQGLRWRDRGGKVWDVREMHSSHIRNSMRMLLRGAPGEVQRALGEGLVRALIYANGDKYAQLKLDDFKFYSAYEWVRRSPIMKLFHAELQKRRQRGQNVKASVMSITINRVRGAV
jgi:hypothetical protein